MINKDQAEEVVNQFLHGQWSRQQDPDPSNPLVIIEEATLERDWGWVFFGNYKRFLVTHDFWDCVVGLGPLCVNKRDGTLRELDIAMGEERALALYETFSYGGTLHATINDNSLDQSSHPFFSGFLIDKAQATEIVNRFLHAQWSRQAYPDPQNPVIIYEEATLEEKWCWVFFYDLKRAIETQNSDYGLLGNRPLIVDKVDGSLHEIELAHSLPVVLAEYEKKRNLTQAGPKIYELEESD